MPNLPPTIDLTGGGPTAKKQRQIIRAAYIPALRRTDTSGRLYLSVRYILRDDEFGFDEVRRLNAIVQGCDARFSNFVGRSGTPRQLRLYDPVRAAITHPSNNHHSDAYRRSITRIRLASGQYRALSNSRRAIGENWARQFGLTLWLFFSRHALRGFPTGGDDNAAYNAIRSALDPAIILESLRANP